MESVLRLWKTPSYGCSLDLPTSLTLRDRHIDERHFMSSTQAAVVLGASGSVGNALIKELIRNGSFKPIVTLVRRSQPDQVAMARDAGVELRETG
jgi:hypothetical protein